MEANNLLLLLRLIISIFSLLILQIYSAIIAHFTRPKITLRFVAGAHFVKR